MVGESGKSRNGTIYYYYKYGSIHDKAYQREIIGTFLNSVYVYDDRIVFTYNFRDHAETVTLDEIEYVFCSDVNDSPPPMNPRIVSILGFFAAQKVALSARSGVFPAPFWLQTRSGCAILGVRAYNIAECFCRPPCRSKCRYYTYYDKEWESNERTGLL